jgi:cytochrome c556
MKKPVFAAALLAAAFATPALAQFAKPEDAIKYRQAAFQLLGNHFGHLGGMATGRTPFDAAGAAADAEVLAVVAKLPARGFVPGSDTGNTKAKPEIWKEQAKFKEMNDKMVAEVGKLAVAAKGGNLDQIKAAFGPAAQSCKACHDQFRNR